MTGAGDEHCERDFEIRQRENRHRLHNVQERMQLYFGQNYGMEVESEPDEGTRLESIPARTVGEMEWMEVAGVSKNRKYALLIAGAILFAWFIFGWDGAQAGGRA